MEAGKAQLQHILSLGQNKSTMVVQTISWTKLAITVTTHFTPSWRGSGGLGFIDSRRESRGFPEFMKTPGLWVTRTGVPLLGLFLSLPFTYRLQARCRFPHVTVVPAITSPPLKESRQLWIRWSQFVWTMGPSSAAHSVEHALPAGIREASWPPVGTASEPGPLPPQSVTCPEAFSCSVWPSPALLYQLL